MDLEGVGSWVKDPLYVSRVRERKIEWVTREREKKDEWLEKNREGVKTITHGQTGSDVSGETKEKRFSGELAYFLNECIQTQGCVTIVQRNKKKKKSFAKIATLQIGCSDLGAISVASADVWHRRGMKTQKASLSTRKWHVCCMSPTNTRPRISFSWISQ